MQVSIHMPQTLFALMKYSQLLRSNSMFAFSPGTYMQQYSTV